MNRRHLAFLVLVNALVSLVVALGVVLAFEARRPDPEELAAIATPRAEPVLAVPIANTPVATPVAASTEGAEPVVATVVNTPTAPTEEASGEEEIYVVQPGDTLLGIATRYSITVDDILRANNLTNPDYVFSGQRLVIPVQGAGGAQGSAGESTRREPVVEGILISAVSGAGTLADEVVQVANESDTAINLQGWRLEQENGPAYTFGNVPLFPGGGVRVHSGPGVDTTLDLYWGRSEPVWQSGDLVRLLNTQGAVVSIYTVP